MKRFAIAAAVISLAAGASTAHAQAATSSMTNRTRGFMLNGHLQISPGMTIKGIQAEDAGVELGDVETKLGFGGGLQLGYGVTRMIMPYINLDLSKQDIEDEDGTGDFGVSHVELGARFNFPGSGGPVVPYLNVGVGARGLGAEDEESGEDVSITGGHLAVGGGVQYFFGRKFAFDAGVQVGFGKYSTIKFGDEDTDIDSDNSVSSRIKLGVSWFPQAR